MIDEAEINGQTGITYQRGNTHNLNTMNLLHPAISFAGTGEDTRLRYRGSVPSEFYQILPACKSLTATTGYELHDIDVIILVAASYWQGITDYHANFELNNLTHTNIYAKQLARTIPDDRNTAAIQVERLKEISGLTVERLVRIFGVSRTTYHNWITGSPLHNTHRDHLLEVLALVEEANQRLASPAATNMWLLTPVSPGGKKPIDYLAERAYSTFRGFLLRVRNGQEVFKPLTPSKRVHIERSKEDTEDARERLRPRVWRDDDDNNQEDI